MRDSARTESVEEIRASSVKQQPTSPSTHEYERAMLTARSYSLGRAGGTTSVRLLRLSRCRVCFLRSFLRSLCTVGIEQPSPPGPRKGEAAGADGNRGTAVPPFPQRYGCYGIENKNNEETSKARGLITRPPNRGQAHSRSTKTATLAAAKTKVLRPPLAAEYAPFYAAINSSLHGWP